MVSTWYGQINDATWQQFQKVRLLVCDVDGVFSDGRIYLGNDGEELKAFNTRDGYGVKSLLAGGIEVAVVTGRQSAIVESRMKALGVGLIYQGVKDKAKALEDILQKTRLQPEDAAAVGDDCPDLPLLTTCGLALTVHDGHPQVQQTAHYVTQNKGGSGAVREIADLILLSQGKLHQLQSRAVQEQSI